LPDHLALLRGRQAVDVRALRSPTPKRGSTCAQRWKCPQPSTLKLNVDGFFKDLSAVIQMGSGHRNLACSPLLMELMAYIEGISAAVQLGINKHHSRNGRATSGGLCKEMSSDYHWWRCCA